ncbi:MAG: FAD-binding oxidoreductase [Actinobacteria bacterium]|nr:FAD-binding oxidoreductase [Actinomycetota bacterium]
MIPGLADTPLPSPSIGDVVLPSPRVSAPTTLAEILTDDPAARASHARGKAYRDVIRALHGDVGAAPDLVARPATEADVVAVLDWASEADVAVVPYGGGSSVVGGVECDGDGHAGVVTLDLSAMDRVLEIDTISRAARIQAGVLGPALEDQLRPADLTLRHFPQSFEFSSLGGWIATRAGGHYATLHTHIDDFVESVRVVTPIGTSESWRLPGSGAGPSPDRLFLGSEGTLGVITEAWMRLQDRPAHRRSTTVTFTSTTDAMAAVRAIAQSGLHPANCRLLDPGEAALSGAGSGAAWVLVLGVESAHHPVDATLALLVDIARGHDGTPADPAPPTTAEAPTRDRAAEAWRSTFLRMPYLRDGLARMSAISETFETATTWDRVEALYEDVRAAVGDAVRTVTGTDGLVTCRFTHVYPDGAAPYFTVIGAARRGSELAMWDEIKAASMEVLTRHRATVTHHHAVGRDHRPGYDRQRPDPFAAALVATKRALDPKGILNPGVLVDP